MIFKNGRSFIVQSKRYLQFERDCAYFLKKYSRHIETPINLKCLFFVPDKRRRDLCNLLNGMQDVLVKYDVLADDNSNIVVGVDGSRIIYEKRKRRNDNRNHGGKDMTLTEKQEQFLVKHQDTYTLKRLGEILHAKPSEVYKYYSEMVENGKIFKYWKKQVPGWQREKENDTQETLNNAESGVKDGRIEERIFIHNRSNDNI